ncbi:MAG TPA: M48 family metallopeptidase [Solimonas sp.]|nr:M48 family metallopeptidase [Solimonas sp.]
MSYENPPLPEEVNVGRENVLLEFLRLAAGLAVVMALISAAMYFGGSRLARLIPFDTERRWVGERVLGIEVASNPKHAEVEAYLRGLTARLAAQMDMPPGMELRVHYADTALPNAFASLGGHIAVTRGLYERMDSENALALVLAHEIAHVRARDPIAGIGGSASMILAVTLLTGNAGNLSAAFAGVVQRGYSRRAEEQADEAAIAALRRVYGHAGGGAAVFEGFARWRQEGHGLQGPSLLSTHPLDEERIARLKQAAQGWDAQRQPLVALPAQK